MDEVKVQFLVTKERRENEITLRWMLRTLKVGTLLNDQVLLLKSLAAVKPH